MPESKSAFSGAHDLLLVIGTAALLGGLGATAAGIPELDEAIRPAPIAQSRDPDSLRIRAIFSAADCPCLPQGATGLGREKSTREAPARLAASSRTPSEPRERFLGEGMGRRDPKGFNDPNDRRNYLLDNAIRLHVRGWIGHENRGNTGPLKWIGWPEKEDEQS